jgi:glutathione S-transferase
MRSAATKLLLAFAAQWQDLEHLMPPKGEHNIVIDSALDPLKPNYSNKKPTLYRERHGWCPYSERVWLALEHCNVPYDTIRIDNTGPGQRPPYFSGQTPQMRWPEGKIQGESMDLVREVNDRFGGDLYPSADVSITVEKFRKIFPSKSRPSSRAAFLFGWSGEPLWKSEFERVLSETNELLSETDGPFFNGKSFSASDIAWAPFLERYGAQLPCLHEGLNPRDASKYPHLNNWYTAMETTVPAYACRVQGNPSSWRKVLTMAGYGNAGVPPDVIDRMDDFNAEESRPQSEEERVMEQKLWDDYRSSRPWLALTPSAEAGKTLLNNRQAIVKDTLKRATSLEGKGIPLDEDNLDCVMRALATILIYGTSADGKYDELEHASAEAASVNGVYAFARFLDERMCVPRDMSSMSAAAIKRLAALA